MDIDLLKSLKHDLCDGSMRVDDVVENLLRFMINEQEAVNERNKEIQKKLQTLLTTTKSPSMGGAGAVAARELKSFTETVLSTSKNKTKKGTKSAKRTTRKK